jgi:hypothetical protein
MDLRTLADHIPPITNVDSGEAKLVATSPEVGMRFLQPGWGNETLAADLDALGQQTDPDFEVHVETLSGPVLTPA